MNQLIITNSTITFNHQVIKTSNISSIDLKQLKNHIPLIVIGSLLGFAGLHSLGRGEMIGIFIIAVSAACFWFNYKRKQKYFLAINTNAGSQELFQSGDYDFINGIRVKIQEAMDVNGQAINITYNLDNKTVINNPTGNITITNVTQYQGLSEDDKNYIKNYFEPALQKIQNEVLKNNNDELRRNFEMLKQELKSSKPRKSIIEAAWSVFGNVSTLADLASIFEKVASMNF